MCFNGDKKKIYFNISNGVKANITKLEVPTNKSFQETLGFLKTILARYHHEVKHMVVLTILLLLWITVLSKRSHIFNCLRWLTS
jgi:hypothetical protein